MSDCFSDVGHSSSARAGSARFQIERLCRVREAAAPISQPGDRSADAVAAGPGFGVQEDPVGLRLTSKDSRHVPFRNDHPAYGKTSDIPFETSATATVRIAGLKTARAGRSGRQALRLGSP